MDKMKIVKLVIRVVASASVGTVVGNVIKMNTPLTMSVADKVMTKIGSFVITSMISEKGADYVMETISEAVPATTVEPKPEKEEPK